jgi:two-component system, OmpR family, phosphate regulon sensor histidine kinase PhoR
MKVNSRAVSLLLAISIGLVTLAFLSLLPEVGKLVLFIAFIISFASSYILINLVLEFLIFKEINKIYTMMAKLKRKDLSFVDKNKGYGLNPLKRINDEINSYASLKQREIDELKKLAAFRREFLADVSHELKTPIFAAQGFIHTLLDGAVDDEEVREKFLQKAAKSLDGLDMLVQDLLTLSNMEAGEIKMHYEEFNIYELVKEIFEQMEVKASKRNVNISFSRPDQGVVMVYADQKRIYQVMQNLISNAIKYSDGGEVKVDFEIHKNHVLISVKDTGPGIQPEHLNRIFERFYRIEKSRSKDSGGTGLGLAIVKHIVEAHGSEILAKSIVGKGSVFSFQLPIPRTNKKESTKSKVKVISD